MKLLIKLVFVIIFVIVGFFVFQLFNGSKFCFGDPEIPTNCFISE